MKADSLSDTAEHLVDEGRETLNDLADKGMDYVSSANSVLTDFVRGEPLLAMATVFAAGYLVARVLNQLSRR